LIPGDTVAPLVLATELGGGNEVATDAIADDCTEAEKTAVETAIHA
jgi:hypothetical protein